MKQNFSSDKMKIAVFVRNPNAGGGIQVFAKELARRMPTDIEMWFISKNELFTSSNDLTLKSKSYFEDFKFILKSFDLILMHQFSLKFYALARLANRPIIVVTHIWDIGEKDFKSVLLRRIKKRFLSKNDLNLIFVSESVRNNLGLNGEVILNRSTFSQLTENTETLKKDLLFVGRFYIEKGVHVFLDIVRSLNMSTMRPVSATMIGEGPEIHNLETSIIEYGLEGQVELIPWMDRESLREMYTAHHILIVPSLWDEPYGLVAAEGLSLGLKVFCSNRPGLIEATLNCAIYFDPTSISNVTRLIEKELRHDSQIRSDTKIIAELDFSTTVGQYCKLFHKIRSEYRSL